MMIIPARLHHRYLWLIGLQGFHSDAPEIRSLISVLKQQIERSDAMLSGQAIGNAFYGLQV
jgi:hypothetical protein